MRVCPTCGESCAQAWCGFCERALPGCCALGTCTDPACWICVGMQAAFTVVPCPGVIEDERCRFVAGHRGDCQPPRKTKKSENVLRDGEPATKRRDPTFTPRRRVGPHR